MFTTCFVALSASIGYTNALIVAPDEGIHFSCESTWAFGDHYGLVFMRRFLVYLFHQNYNILIDFWEKHMIIYFVFIYSICGKTFSCEPPISFFQRRYPKNGMSRQDQKTILTEIEKLLFIHLILYFGYDNFLNTKVGHKNFCACEIQ